MVNDEDLNESESENESDTEKKKGDVSDDDDTDDDDTDDDDDGYNVDPKLVASELVMSDDDGDGDDDDDDLNENYLQKLDSDVTKSIIEDFHPEILSHNVEEVETACTIVRDENGNIVDPMHRTLSFVTRYEKARVIGERAKQINSGAKPLIPIDLAMIDGYVIALQEFEQKKIPFIIRRPLPNGCSEYWRLADLDII